MSLIAGWATNKGVVRTENQDCCYVNMFESAAITVGIAIMCDGMGGLSEGAVASKSVCDLAEKWFNNTFLAGKQSVSLKPDEIKKQLSKILEISNKELINYGKKKRIQIGTTTSILFLYNGKYYIVHIGDSRIYGYSSSLKQLTDDDSVAAEKLRRGEISQTEYDTSREKHILTQCVGVNKKLNLHIYSGDYSTGDVFFLCSDGMYHNMTSEELSSLMYAQRKERGSQSTTSIERTIDKMISRGEKDNLTGIFVCVV